MARAYAQVLIKIKADFKVIGRGEASAKVFYGDVGVSPIIGGASTFFSEFKLSDSDYVIIATGTESLMPMLKLVLNAGAGRVLIEKPAAISIEELLENQQFLQPYAHKVFVAYNRRFYASVIEVLKLIEEDGGLENIHFEFTEWAHKIEPLEKAKGVKENWFFANSTHVIDLAFYIAGNPIDWNHFNKIGGLNWHPVSKFAGAGVTTKDVLFTYNSNWESAGRWSIELMTKLNRYYLRPMEELWVQKKGAIEVKKYEMNYDRDIQFKPGLFLQVEEFLKDDISYKTLLCLDKHIENSNNIYSKMLRVA